MFVAVYTYLVWNYTVLPHPRPPAPKKSSFFLKAKHFKVKCKRYSCTETARHDDVRTAEAGLHGFLTRDIVVSLQLS